SPAGLLSRVSSDFLLLSSQLLYQTVTQSAVFVLNTLAMGVAIQTLAKITGETIEIWKEYVNATANEQYRELSSQQIQEIVDSIKDLSA
ncbi:MAG: hypothetical protein V7K55_04875, partial [Nostoc sp.]|uniref:hypothetical protein n=1 Tax=Nostoc sp. TaxID=1180 RepID=UPI002FF806F8